MERVDSGSRQSDALPSFTHLDFEKVKKEGAAEYFGRRSTVVGSALPSPTTVYSGPPPPYSSSTAGVMPITSGLISPPDSRRTSGDDKEQLPQQPRLSLPSIHEALSGDQNLAYSAPPQSNAAVGPPPPSSTAASAIPSAAAIPRTHPLDAGQTHGPPNPFSQGPAAREQPPTGPPQPPYQPSESAPPSSRGPYPNESRLPPLPSLSTAHSAPHPAAVSSQPPPNFDPAPRSAGSANPQFGGYNHYSPHYSYPQQPPNGPPAGYGTSYYAPVNSRPGGWRGDGPEMKRVDESRSSSLSGPVDSRSYGQSVKRHLDIFDLESSLVELADFSRRILDFSNVYSGRAHQTSRSGPLPGSMPTLTECDDMMRSQEHIGMALARIREVIINQQQAIQDQRSQEPYKGPNDYDLEENGGVYHDDTKGGGGFAGSDPKKRRGRAAPPGRCHSCNRAETPEWRRGPDGARTLCNACGLHYAKLTRKMGNKASISGSSSNLRPKEMGAPSPH